MADTGTEQSQPDTNLPFGVRAMIGLAGAAGKLSETVGALRSKISGDNSDPIEVQQINMDAVGQTDAGASRASLEELFTDMGYMPGKSFDESFNQLVTDYNGILTRIAERDGKPVPQLGEFTPDTAQVYLNEAINLAKDKQGEQIVDSLEMQGMRAYAAHGNGFATLDDKGLRARLEDSGFPPHLLDKKNFKGALRFMENPQDYIQAMLAVKHMQADLGPVDVAQSHFNLADHISPGLLGAIKGIMGVLVNFVAPLLSRIGVDILTPIDNFARGMTASRFGVPIGINEVLGREVVRRPPPAPDPAATAAAQASQPAEPEEEQQADLAQQPRAPMLVETPVNPSFIQRPVAVPEPEAADEIPVLPGLKERFSDEATGASAVSAQTELPFDAARVQSVYELINDGKMPIAQAPLFLNQDGETYVAGRDLNGEFQIHPIPVDMVSDILAGVPEQPYPGHEDKWRTDRGLMAERLEMAVPGVAFATQNYPHLYHQNNYSSLLSKAGAADTLDHTENRLARGAERYSMVFNDTAVSTAITVLGNISPVFNTVTIVGAGIYQHFNADQNNNEQGVYDMSEVDTDRLAAREGTLEMFNQNHKDVAGRIGFDTPATELDRGFSGPRVA